MLPATGVYAVPAGLRRGARPAWRPAVANLGRRPTFDGRALLLEVHLLEGGGDLYGQRLRVAFTRAAARRAQVRRHRRAQGADRPRLRAGPRRPRPHSCLSQFPPMSTDYRDTVFLPRTDFPMKADLPKREPELGRALGRGMDLYARLREASAGREKFVLHDGPPYANGHLHMGTALNKILKDVVNRSQQMLGKDAPYVPGWDCHGLPIEWQIEQEYRKKGKDKDAVPIADFRRECREFAAALDRRAAAPSSSAWACSATGPTPTRPWTFSAEAGIFRELGKFLLDGALYRGKKSVMWSVVEKTALAEAEVEYHDHTSTTIWVRFPLVDAEPAGAGGRRGGDLDHDPLDHPGQPGRGLRSRDRLPPDRGRRGRGRQPARPGERLVVAVERLAEVADDGRHPDPRHARSSSTARRWPAASPAIRWPASPTATTSVPLLPGEFVTTEQGTGLVHIAPSHGEDDFELGASARARGAGHRRRGRHLHRGGAGLRRPARVQGRRARDRGAAEHGNLLARGKLVHSYPHSWRSKAPLIFRATAQWFIPMDGRRAAARQGAGRDRRDPLGAGARPQPHLRSMIETRPDWCVSRQRAWGVPIAVFVHKATGEVLRDPEVVERIARAFEEEGADAWWTRDPQEFLGNAYAAEDYEKVDDILDVWFDSGCTHATVLEQRPELQWPASLYLEGSDQHRGWFHSSLLESCGTRGRAPYEAVLTHGFVVDAEGRKMSKSLGNVVSPIDLMKTHGADILRLWVVSGDYTEDMRIGKEILDGIADTYRRLRNTLRYLLGNLDGFSDAERLPPGEMPELERWVLHRLAELDELVRSCNARVRLPAAVRRSCTISAPSTCRRSTSTSARTRSTATGRTACGAAPRAPCSTSCSAA